MPKMMDKPENPAASAMPLDDWYQNQFVPWKDAMRRYTEGEQARQAKLHRHVGQLQTIVAMLLDGKPKQALMAWNTLQLHPTLDAIELGRDGASMVLTEPSGNRTVLMMDDVIAELEGLLREREIPRDGERREA